MGSFDLFFYIIISQSYFPFRISSASIAIFLNLSAYYKGKLLCKVACGVHYSVISKQGCYLIWLFRLNASFKMQLIVSKASTV